MRLLLILLIILFFALALLFIVSTIELSKYRIIHYRISHNKLPKSFNGYRIALLSDMHCNEFKNGNKRLIEDIKKERPDIIVLSGDMITARKGEQTSGIAQFINELSALSKVYYSYGNHELALREKREEFPGAWDNFIEELHLSDKLIMLDNSCVDIVKGEEKLRLIGLTLPLYYFKRFGNNPLTNHKLEALIGPKTNEFNILCAHKPDYFQEYTEWGADLVLSGHIHGGLVRIPFLGGVISPSMRLFPKYTRGIYSYKKSKMVLTSGLGAHTLKIRFNNIPEAVIINLETIS